MTVLPAPATGHYLPLRRLPGGSRCWRHPHASLPEVAGRRPLLLASVSPRRRDLLARAGLAFVPCDPGEDPDLPHLEGWRSAALRALHKALRGAWLAPGLLSLGADTVVVHRGRSLGKPADPLEAHAMLAALSGEQHEVFTAYCLAYAARGSGRRADKRRPLWLEIVRSEVSFHRLSPAERAAYVASGAPLDKAGGYGIQDRQHQIVERVRGSYYNVVGLPLLHVLGALWALGWQGPSPVTAGREAAAASGAARFLSAINAGIDDSAR